MAEQDIVQNMISRLGQSQSERAMKELDVHFADVDARTTADLLRFTREFAKIVNYYSSSFEKPAGNWESFFSFSDTAIEQLLANSAGDIPPHQALLLAFLRLYQEPQRDINTITARHLDFFYQRILRLAKKPAVPDKVHVLLELKKNSKPFRILPADVFSAGKDGSGAELIYAPVRETVVGQSKVTSLRSIFLDHAGHGTVRAAPVANSADGAGAELPEDNPKWPGFGHSKLHAAEIGFAISSPVLRMKEGSRQVKVFLTLGSGGLSKIDLAALSKVLEAHLTGEKGWLGPKAVTCQSPAQDVLLLQCDIPASDAAAVDYDPAIHGYSFAAGAPVLQILLKSDSTAIGYLDLRDLTLRKVKIAVEVSGISGLALESDAGALDAKKAFLPFGPVPTAGSRFVVGCPEAFAKKLSRVKVSVQWKDLPGNFATRYQDYGVYGVGDAYFTARVSFCDSGSWRAENVQVKLFDPRPAAGAMHSYEFTPTSPSGSAAISEGMKVYALSSARTRWAVLAANRNVRLRPVLRPYTMAAPQMFAGAMVFFLEKDFLHATYRQKTIENIFITPHVVLQEPYTPAIQSISFSYEAHSDEVSVESTELSEEVRMESRELADFSNPDAKFFHIGCFGQMREHGFQRALFPFVPDKHVPLLPLYNHEGELLIGISGLQAKESVNVLFQLAEGSADPSLERAAVEWSVLCDNYWKSLGTTGVPLDTTNQLLASGTIQFVIPPEATTDNTLLPSGLLWLKAAIQEQGGVAAVCQLIDVEANAVELKFQPSDNDPEHLNAPLLKGKIAKLKTGLPEVKTVTQPYASFGGRPGESAPAFATRVSERLRHKNRCLTAWDYERIVLEAFPGVHKVKCIPHAKPGSWLSPGHVLLVVIPDLRNTNALDPLQPRVDSKTLREIEECVRQRCGMWVRRCCDLQLNVKAKNPEYQKIRLDFKVKFRAGYEFGLYSNQVRKELMRFLSPWAFDAEGSISFGGKVYKSVLLDFVEELDYVDYVTDFKMFSYRGDQISTLDISEARPETPDAILVSDREHVIGMEL